MDEPVFSRGQKVGAIVLLVAVISLLVVVVSTVSNMKSARSEASACIVNDKQVISRYQAKSDYRIFTDNCGVLNISDSLLIGRWDSADIYNQVKVGKTYNFKTVGKRVPLLSLFPNISGVEEVQLDMTVSGDFSGGSSDN